MEQTTYVKYLGLIVDCHVNWKEKTKKQNKTKQNKKHVNEVTKEVSRGIGILSKPRHFVTDDILTQLYYSLVYPFLAYGLVVWEILMPQL